MKRTVLLLLGALVVAGGVFADDTPTPTITPTFTPTITTTVGSQTVTPSATPTNTFNLSDTPTPTITPTYTITPSFTRTFTVTLTYTRTAVPVLYGQRFKRVYIEPKQFRLADSVSKPVLTPAAGKLYLAKDNGILTAVMAVPTPATPPTIRIRWTVPQDFQGWPYPMRLWFRGVESEIGASPDNTFCVNAYRMWNNSASTVLTSTAQNNYANIQTMTGSCVNVQTQGAAYSLAQTTRTAKRVLLTAPTEVSQCAKGDEMEFEIIRTTGTGTLTIYGVEIEYDKKPGVNP